MRYSVLFCSTVMCLVEKYEHVNFKGTMWGKISLYLCQKYLVTISNHALKILYTMNNSINNNNISVQICLFFKFQNL